MKYVLLIVFISALFVSPAAAQNRKTFTINPGQKITDAIPKEEIFIYPEFVAGTVYFKSETAGAARLNYNELTSEIQFIDPNGDTLSLSEEPAIKFIVIKKDTFYYDKDCLKLLETVGETKLAAKPFFEFVNRQRVGGFGEATSASVEAHDKLSVSGTGLKDIVPKEIITLAKDRQLYVGDRFGHFKVASKKNILSLYGKKEKEAQTFLKENDINFASENDVKKLIVYLNSLN